MSDLIDRQKALNGLKYEMKYGAEIDRCGLDTAYDIIENVPSAEPERKKGEWIPFTMRELTDEEREENPEWDWVFTCKLPADGETVLLTNGKYVWEDMFCCDDGCYFDKADDIEDYDGYAWMPLPEPYRGEE